MDIIHRFEKLIVYEPVITAEGGEICLRLSIFRKPDNNLTGAFEILETVALTLLNGNIFHSRIWTEDDFTTALIQSISCNDIDEYLSLVAEALDIQFASQAPDCNC